MFNCGFCLNLTEPGQKGKLIVTKWREKDYPSEAVAPEPGSFAPKHTKPGKGFEIVTEKRACPKCLERVSDAPPPREQKGELARL